MMGIRAKGPITGRPHAHRRKGEPALDR